jgi:hypothetical protein
MHGRESAANGRRQQDDAILLAPQRRHQVDDPPVVSRRWHEAKVTIDPVQFGTGLKIKTVEALAQGTALVTTTCGASGCERGAGPRRGASLVIPPGAPADRSEHDTESGAEHVEDHILQL